MNFSHTDLKWNDNMKYLMLLAYMAIILDLKSNPYETLKIVETLTNNCFPPDGFYAFICLISPKLLLYYNFKILTLMKVVR